MATLEQIAAALQAADKAGNVEDARALAQAYIAEKQRLANRSEQMGFFEAVRSGAGTLKTAPEAVKFAQAPSYDADAARKAFLAAQEPEKATTSFADVKDLSSFVDYAKQQAGQSAGYLIPPGAAGAAARILSKSPGIGKAVGLGVLGAQYAVENLGRQAGEQQSAIERGQMPEETSVAGAVGAAAGQTALDAIGIEFFKPLFSRFPFVKNLLGEEGGKVAKESEDALLDAVRNGTLKRSSGIITGIGKGVAFEVPQEIAQQMLERAQAGLSLTDEDARNEYYEAGAGAVLLGAPLGGMGKYFENRGKIQEAEDIKFRRDLEREMAKAKEKKEAEAVKTAEKETVKAGEKEAKKQTAAEEFQANLDQARNILLGIQNPDGTPVRTESRFGEFKTALIESGFEAQTADKILRQFEKSGILTKESERGVRSISPEAQKYDVSKLGEGISKEEAKKEEAATKAEEEIPFTAPKKEEVKPAAPTPTEFTEESVKQLEQTLKQFPQEIQIQVATAMNTIIDDGMKKGIPDQEIFKQVNDLIAQTQASIKAQQETAAKTQAEAQAKAARDAEEAAARQRELEAQQASAQEAGGERGTEKPAAGVAEQVDTGAGTAGVSVSVPRPGAERSDVADLAGQRVGDTGQTAERVVRGKEPRESALKAQKTEVKLQDWQKQFEKTAKRYKPDDPTSPLNILARVNALKALLPAGEDLQYIADIQDIIGVLKRTNDINTVEDKVGIDRAKLEEYLDDLRTNKIITDNNEVIQEAVTSPGKDNSNRDIPSKLDKFLETEEPTILQAANELDRLLDKYESKDVTNRDKVRKSVSDNLAKIEEQVAAEKERAAARRAAAKEASATESEAEFRQREAGAYERAQRAMENDTTDDLLTYSSRDLKSVVDSNNANNILDYIANRAAENQKYELSGEFAAQSAETEAGKVRAPKIDTTGLTPEEAEKRLESAKRKAQREAARVRAGIEAELTGTGLDISSVVRQKRQQNRFAEEIARRLRSLDYSNVGIQVEGSPNADASVFARMRNDRHLAEYDPKTNTIYLTKEGMTPKVILHEMVHAGTVRALQEYENPETRAKMSRDRREAAEHLYKIYDAAKKRLKGRFPKAFESVYEFVSYAMTEPKFQRELARLRSPSLAKYTKMVQDLWEQFTDAVSRMFGLLTPTEVRAALKSRGKGTEEKIKTLLPKTAATTDEREFIERSIRSASAASDIETFRRMPEGNLLLETSEAFHNLLMPPSAGIEMKPLAAAQRITAPAAKERTFEQVEDERRSRFDAKHNPDTALNSAVKYFKTQEGFEWLVRKFQNDRRPLKTLEDALVRSAKLIVGEKGFNNLYSLISLSSGNAFHRMTQYLQADMTDVHKGIEQYARASKMSVRDALNRLDYYMIALHENERRRVKYLKLVPLDDRTRVTIGGVTATPAEHRQRILNMLETNQDLTQAAPRLREIVDQLVRDYAKADGKSTRDVKPGTLSLDINDPVYNVIGDYTQTELAAARAKYAADPNKAIIDKMRKSMDRIRENTIALDKDANYWTQPTTNIKEFYGFKNYVPFKGKPGTKAEEEANEYNYDGARLSGELAETTQSFEGRMSDSENSILQTLADGAKSAMRSGRKDVTQAIKNMIDQGLIDGSAKKSDIIEFSDRKNALNEPKYKGNDKIYHYLPDGSVQVLTIDDRRMLEAIRRVYRDKSPFIDFANRITSGIGQVHTRYNPAFHPYNFVRDALTNAFTLGAEFGPEKSKQLINNVATRVGNGGMMKAGKISKLYAEANMKELDKLRKEDPFANSIMEYLEEGGRISYVQGLAIRSQIDELNRDIMRSPLTRGKEKLDKWVDIWTDTFELTSRAAAYEVLKAEFSKTMPEKAARQQAAAYAKNLANFEQVGQWGREAGALYMFFRPAATGAVRAIDALTPLLQSEESALNRLPDAIKEDPVARRQFLLDFSRRKEATKTMVMSLAGAGLTLYLMAYTAADDDDYGRNKVATDDMGQWSRNLRMPLDFMGIKPLKDNYLQLPWGFGLGAFAAAGAQVGGMAMGKTSIVDGAANMVSIALDSYLPLPVARFNPMENFPAWAMDSLAPSAARPFLEYVMNVDTFGREIYNNRMSKYGDAYTGGANVPDLYNRAARALFGVTNAQVDISPSTMYFFTNNYVDGWSRILHNSAGLYDLASGKKGFDPKRDLLFMDSFFGKKSSVDAREFASIQKQAEEKGQRLRTLQMRPELYRRYLESYPNDPAIVAVYNKVANSLLRDVRQEMNRVRAGNDTPLVRKAKLDDLARRRDFIMRRTIERMKDFGMEP